MKSLERDALYQSVLNISCPFLSRISNVVDVSEYTFTKVTAVRGFECWWSHSDRHTTSQQHTNMIKHNYSVMSGPTPVLFPTVIFVPLQSIELLIVSGGIFYSMSMLPLDSCITSLSTQVVTG